jgi:gamma-glutamylcyclotransferase (GGCT)/AIG2-like uncharacterized protein YtfP
MPLLFSYGTLQKAEVQRANFGRLLAGQADELPGYEPTVVTAANGLTHANARCNERSEHRVRGTVFEVTEQELLAADDYERSAEYLRVAVILASGRQAWVYVDARPEAGTSTG